MDVAGPTPDASFDVQRRAPDTRSLCHHRHEPVILIVYDARVRADDGYYLT